MAPCTPTPILAVAVAECCFAFLGRDAVGASVDLSSNGLTNESLLFSESPSRIVISFSSENLEAVSEIVADTPFAVIGKVESDTLHISIDEKKSLSSPVAELEAVWETALEKRLESSASAAS